MKSPKSKPPHLILASASPRRAELLKKVGYDFTVIISPLQEPSRKPPNVPLEFWPISLAYLKAAAVKEQIENAGGRKSKIENYTILAADTIVILPSPKGPQILNKPANRSHARRMLKRLSGKTHTVITGLCLLTPTARRLASASATCHFQKLTATQLEAYLNTNRWKGKAGAYGIQNRDPFIKLLTGHITTVIGLPLPLLKRELAKFLNPSPQN